MKHDLVEGEIYTLTQPVVATTPLGSRKLVPGERVMYLEMFNKGSYELPIICEIKKGERTNSIALVTPGWLTNYSAELIEKTLELLLIYHDSDNANYYRNDVFLPGSYSFVKMAQHIIDNYNPKALT